MLSFVIDYSLQRPKIVGKMERRKNEMMERVMGNRGNMGEMGIMGIREIGGNRWQW